MALDKLVDSTQLDADLTTVANAIRTKGGTSAQLAFPQGMADAIAAIPSGGTPTRTKWWRPPDMPDITSLNLDKTKYLDAALTIDTYRTDAENKRIKIYASGAAYSFGTMEGGVYTELSRGNLTRSAWVDLPFPETDKRFLVFRVTKPISGSFYIKLTNENAKVYIVEEYMAGTNWSNVFDTPSWCNYMTVNTDADFTLDASKLKMQSILDFSESNCKISLDSTAYFQNKPVESIIPPQQGFKGTAQQFRSMPLLRELDLTNSVIPNMYYWFENCSNLETLNLSSVDMSSSSVNSSTFKGLSSLTNVITDTDTVFPSVNFSLSSSSPLTNASLINIANALPIGTATITLHATPKAKLSTIMGTVADGVFTADESGDTTLLSFINNTKGWTVA